MSEVETIERKIKLKQQALGLIQEEIKTLSHIQALAEIREFLLSKGGRDFDPEISAYLDHVQILIDFLSGGHELNWEP
jgi:hypothetical protein